jgi:hypothetical protein
MITTASSLISEIFQKLDTNATAMTFISRHYRLGLPVVFAAAACAVAAEARADESIGVASLVRNNVNGVLPSRIIQINVGENVIRNEIVKTGQDSLAKLVFTDSTNLSVGPNSTVKLDKFVAAGPASYDKATINLAKGAFRFVTGHSDKRAYEIKTGVATIGVRGTIVEGRSEPGALTVDVREGVAHVCTIPRPGEDKDRCRKCRDLEAGDSAVFTSCAAMSAPQQPSQFPAEFQTVEEFSAVQHGELLIPEGGTIYTLGAVGLIGGGIGAGVATTSYSGNGIPFLAPAPASP